MPGSKGILPRRYLLPLFSPVQEHHAREDTGEDDLHTGEEESKRPDGVCDLEERTKPGYRPAPDDAKPHETACGVTAAMLARSIPLGITGTGPATPRPESARAVEGETATW